MATDIKTLITKQTTFFASGRTKTLGFRIQQLKRLKAAIKTNEIELLNALHRDLHKSAFEGYTAEIGFVYTELNDAINNLKCWAKPVRAKTPLLHWPSRSRIYSEPKGSVLIIGPWNYPLQLVLSPLIGAIAAGNCVIIKPSEVSRSCEEVIVKLIAEVFPQDHCAVVTGDATFTKNLLSYKFDHIFFTGSTAVGREVMRAAAEHLTPVTLELGGKSPCIVDTHTNMQLSARRIAWGKFYNAGQTCVAPDYLLVHKSIKEEFVEHLRRELVQFFGKQSQNSPDYGRIINDKHFTRLVTMLDGQDIMVGGQHDAASRFIAPTIVDCHEQDNVLMREEIFGPILPVLEYDTKDEALAIVAKYPKPLACYVFSNKRKFYKRVIRDVRFGGGCVNNTLMHVANHHLPFGGVGPSGMGAYHGRTSFDVFSHKKSVMYTPWIFDLWLKYPPYFRRIELIRKLMR